MVAGKDRCDVSSEGSMRVMEVPWLVLVSSVRSWTLRACTSSGGPPIEPPLLGRLVLNAIRGVYASRTLPSIRMWARPSAAARWMVFAAYYVVCSEL